MRTEGRPCGICTWVQNDNARCPQRAGIFWLNLLIMSGWDFAILGQQQNQVLGDVTYQ